MNYSKLIELYFERSNALLWLWTLYGLVVGGLLLFSSLRQRPDKLTAALSLILFGLFASWNLKAIHEVTAQRLATLDLIHVYQPMNGEESPEWWPIKQMRDHVEGTLLPAAWEGVRDFHLVGNAVTVLALLAFEWRRRQQKTEKDKNPRPSAN